MSLVALLLLSKGDMYGYQIVQETYNLSNGNIITQEGSLYPVLYKLVEDGYISDRKVKVGKRMTRVYYHIEPSGIAHMNRLLEDYYAISDGIRLIRKEMHSENHEK